MPGLALELAQQVQDLGLDRHVERGRRLVGDQQLRAHRERHGDHHPLLQAARELVGIGVEARLRVGDARPRSKSSTRPARGLRGGDALVQLDRLDDLVADGRRPGSGSSSAPGRSSRCARREPAASRSPDSAQHVPAREPRRCPRLDRARASAPGAGSRAPSSTSRSPIRRPGRAPRRARGRGTRRPPRADRRGGRRVLAELSALVGEEALIDSTYGCLDIGVEWFTVYAFSTENWRRPRDEVRYLMNFNESLLLRRQATSCTPTGCGCASSAGRRLAGPQAGAASHGRSPRAHSAQPPDDVDDRVQLRGPGRDRRRRPPDHRVRGVGREGGTRRRSPSTSTTPRCPIPI